MIRSFLVKKIDAISTLSQLIETSFHLPSDEIEKALGKHFIRLRDDILIFIEYPYVDRVYRDSYYKYFSTKHYQYERDCARLTFFENFITDNHFRNKQLLNDLKKGILGFIVIRPTIPKLIGRSNISPLALKKHDFEICLCDVDVSVNGVKLRSFGFPHASQDDETMTCAETSIWELMEYFGHQYPEYKPVLPSKIHKTLSNISYERQIPSHGLTLSQISFALKEFDLGTKIYANMEDEKEMQRYLDYYIESGIPVIASYECREYCHAVLIIGREKKNINYLPPDYKPQPIQLKNGNTIQLIDSADIIKNYIIIDDNFPPYQIASFSNPGEYYQIPPFVNYKITGLIVPLYSKVYTDAGQARELTLKILQKFDLHFPPGVVILKLYLISSRSLKNEIALKNDFDSDNKELLLHTPMPKFIWVAEFSTEEQFKNGKSFGLVILNSTDNSIYSAINIIMFDGTTIIARNGQQLILNTSLSIFNTLKNNLKGDWSSWQN